MPFLPADVHGEFILARLWAKGRCVVSHDSALLLHELCNINPTKIHITIPSGYRIGRAGAEPYVIHRADLGSDETMRIGAVTMTTVIRTLTDSLTSAPAYLTRQALETARSQGSIRQADRDRLLRRLTSN